jgi:hypothetical protein
MSKIKTTILFLSIFVSVFLLLGAGEVRAACDYCSEPNCEDYLVCEDFDLDDPGDFPFTEDAWYHEAHVGDYGNPENNRVTSEIAHSGNRCLKMEKVTTDESGGDIEFSFPNQDEIFARWYWYFPEGFAKKDIDGHLLFVNTANHGYLRIDNLSNYLVDHNTGRFWNHDLDKDRKHYIAAGGFESSDEKYCWTCENCQGSGKWTSGDPAKPLYYKHNDYDNTYWRIADNEGRWICFEFYANNTNHTTKLWIDGELWLESDPSMFTWGGEGLGEFDNGFNKIIFSDYRHDSSSPNILYIDDVVVSTSYIGPKEGTPDLTPPSLSNSSPTGTLTSGTTSTTISLTTNETAVCRYSDVANTSYDDMANTFSNTNSTNHSTDVTDLSDGNSYTYYVKCQDESGNQNTDDNFSISFSIASHTFYSISNFITLVTDWLKTETGLESDVNNDGVVNTRDLGIMMSNWQD